MSDIQVDRHWIDTSAVVGDGSNPELDFLVAVHMTLYWGQDMTASRVCELAHPPKRLADRLRRGLPLPMSEVVELSDGRWPLPDVAFRLAGLPAVVDNAALKEGGAVSWRLSSDALVLRKVSPIQGCLYVGEVILDSGPPVSIRQRVMQVGSQGPVPGVMRNIKLISAIRGLYDGDQRMLPVPIRVDTDEEAERFVELVGSGKRKQSVVAIAQAKGEPEDAWRNDIAHYAKEAFTLQHPVAVSLAGVRYLRELLGEHAMPEGAIKTFNPDFTQMDLVQAHPLTLHQTVMAHERGRAGILNRWRIRVMEKEAWNRRHETTDVEWREATR